MRWRPGRRGVWCDLNRGSGSLLRLSWRAGSVCMLKFASERVVGLIQIKTYVAWAASGLPVCSGADLLLRASFPWLLLLVLMTSSTNLTLIPALPLPCVEARSDSEQHQSLERASASGSWRVRQLVWTTGPQRHEESQRHMSRIVRINSLRYVTRKSLISLICVYGLGN